MNGHSGCTQSKSVRIKTINVASQKSNINCVLYVVAMMTSIPYKEDPVNIIYSHAGRLWDASTIVFWKGGNKSILKETVCNVYSTCPLPEHADGSKMIQCDGCKVWHHVKDLNCDLKLTTNDWF